MTNYEKIKSMNVEKLAEMLHILTEDDCCPDRCLAMKYGLPCRATAVPLEKNVCPKTILEWLESEVEE